MLTPHQKEALSELQANLDLMQDLLKDGLTDKLLNEELSLRIVHRKQQIEKLKASTHNLKLVPLSGGIHFDVKDTDFGVEYENFGR